MNKILIAFGTRPEAIKMAPIIKAFKRFPNYFKTNVCVTAQHREMLDQVLTFFNIYPDYDLDLMKPNQNLYDLTADIIANMKTVLDDFRPDYVFVHGDTTTTMAVSIASFYSNTKICHVEAGLRTYNKLSPFPEEINRQITGRLCDFHFAPTLKSKANLINENIKEDCILVTGNTVIDSLLDSVDRVNQDPSGFIKMISKKLKSKEVILVTAHRRENHGHGFERICKALKKIALENNNCVIIFPVHPNPNVKEPVERILKKINNVILTKPLIYPDFVWMMNRSKVIITDSGGIQEEAPSLCKPVLVIRDETERTEAIDSGTAVLVGTDENKIIKETLALLNDRERYQQMSQIKNPYGDGYASDRIIMFIAKQEGIKLNINNRVT